MYIIYVYDLTIIQKRPSQFLNRTLTFQKKSSFVFFNESPLKVMKNAFYFTLKALFAPRIFNFLSWICGHAEKQLDEKDFKILISKFMTSQTRKQTIAIHALLGSSGNKGNQTMKFNQLIEYTMRKIFLEKLYWKCGGETFPKPFSKKSKWRKSLDQ